MRNLTIDPERLWDDLMQTAKIGGTPKGGICRLTLTELDREVRDWFKHLPGPGPAKPCGQLPAGNRVYGVR